MVVEKTEKKKKEKGRELIIQGSGFRKIIDLRLNQNNGIEIGTDQRKQ